MKHKLKMFLREVWARLLYHTGLHALVSRVMPQRLTILASHCVAHQSNAFLPKDMKVQPARLAHLLGWMGRHYDWVTVDEGWQRLQSSEGRSMLVMSMDDGYHDNLEALLPILKQHGVSATVYLESRPLDGEALNWTHKFFWLLGHYSHAELVERYVELSGDGVARERLQAVLLEGGDLTYTLKKVLKYEADQADVETTLTAIFCERGGDESALCRELYLSWEDAEALETAGVELGGHTVHHYVLSGLDAEAQRREVGGGRSRLATRLTAPVSFAYPFGRGWDWNQDSVDAVRDAGFTTATTTHAGTNIKSADPMRLARWMIDDDTPMHLLACEACGGFDLLRRLGLDLSE
jgi:peptidoglycan/xylan/chitin deacetylase (PgdA/CDA1 family)